MGQLVLLVVAAAWAAVLIPPLLRSRIENRPNSSVSDFRNQLSSLQRAMPSRGGGDALDGPPAGAVAAQPSGRRRSPAAAVGRAARTAAPPRRRPGPAGARRRPAPLRAGARPVRRHAPRPQPRRPPAAVRRPARPAPPTRVKRRRANVLFVLVLVAACSLFLAATTKAPGDAVRVRRGVRRPRSATSTCSASCASASRPPAPVPVAGGATAARAGRAGPAGAPTRGPPEAAPGVDPSRSPGPSAVRRPRALGGRLTPRGRAARRRRRAAAASAAVRRRAPSRERPTMDRSPRRLSGPLPLHCGRRGAVAQLVERNNRTVEARGSIPLSSTHRATRRTGADGTRLGPIQRRAGRRLAQPASEGGGEALAARGPAGRC